MSRPLPTPQYLGIDEFARRKGHHYDTILCELGALKVLEVSAGRKKDEVASVLERLSNCDGVKAVSMDMSTTFREAVQLCLPRFPHEMEIVVISDVEYIIRASLYRIFPTNKKEGHWKYDTHLYVSSDPFAGSNRF
jgi:hypothetical protein